MVYVRAVICAVVGALLVGAATGAGTVLVRALAIIPPADGATIFAVSISEAINCAALLLVVLVPLALPLVLVMRRWRRPAGGAG